VKLQRDAFVPRVGTRARLVLVFVAALLPAFVMAVYTAFDERSRLRGDASVESIKLAQLIGAHFEGMLTSTYEVLRALDSDPAVVSGNPGCERRFAHILETGHVPFSSFAVTDGNGDVLCSSPPSRPGATLRGRPIFMHLRGREFAVGEAEIEPNSGDPIVVVAEAVHRADQADRIIAAGVDLRSLTALAERVNLLPGTLFMIVNGDGTVLASHPDPARWVGRNATLDQELVKAIAEQSVPGSVGSRGHDGVYRLFGYSPIAVGGTQFFVVAGLPLYQVMAPADAVLLKTLGGLALAVLVACVGATVIGESFLRRPIERLQQTTRRIASGDYAARVGLPNVPGGDLGDLARGIDDLAQALQDREQHVTALSRRVLDVQEAERRALARELHDEIGQVLTALKLMLQSQRHTDPAQEARRLESIAITDTALQQVRGLSLDLRPPMLDHLGLPATLRWYINRESQRAGFAASCDIQPDGLRLDPHLETSLFRIAQEAMTNVIRHAEANSVVVRLSADNGRVRLSIQDDGHGFDVEAAREFARHGRSLGLLGMEERASLAGGRLAVVSSAAGTEVIATFTPGGTS